MSKILPAVALALSITSCASTYSSKQNSPTAHQELECSADPLTFKRAERLMVNTNPREHYYAELSQEEGERQLRQLAIDSPVEEAFIYIQTPDRSLWFEVGEKETVTSMEISVSGFSNLFHDLRKLCLQKARVTFYHLHTQAALDFLFIPSLLEEYYPQYNNYGVKITYDSRAYSGPSPDDIVSQALHKYLFSKNGLANYSHQPESIITPHGKFSHSMNVKFEMEIIDKVVFGSDMNNVKRSIKDARRHLPFQCPKFRDTTLANSPEIHITLEDLLGYYHTPDFSGPLRVEYQEFH